MESDPSQSKTETNLRTLTLQSVCPRALEKQPFYW
jgi:hypothetical protein